MVTKMEEFVVKIENLNKELKENFKDALKESAGILFQKHQKLETFSWTQYTPYFNDGDPCEFNINDEPHSMIYSGVDIGEYNEEGEYVYDWRTKDLTELGKTLFTDLGEYRVLQDGVIEFINNLQKMEKTVQSILGEGLVIIDRNGVEVEDYDHD